MYYILYESLTYTQLITHDTRWLTQTVLLHELSRGTLD